MTRSAKHYCFTLNNYSNDHKDELKSLFDGGGILYLVYGEEVGDSGTPHLQGYVAFIARKTFNSVKRALPNGSHIEAIKGSPARNVEYCKKDGVFTEFGTPPIGRGQRSDLQVLTERIKSGATFADIENEFPAHALRYRRNILASIRDKQPVRDWETEVVVYWGRTGTGKTRQVFQFHNRDAIYIHPGDKWFDGYQGQPVALFDDYCGNFKLTYLLKLLDRYPWRVPVKGDYVQWAPRIIYFTSNKDPHDWYANALEEHQNALFRRIKTITHFP